MHSLAVMYCPCIAGLGPHQTHVCLHQPHSSPWSSGALACRFAGDPPAQTPADNLPHQPDPPRCMHPGSDITKKNCMFINWKHLSYIIHICFVTAENCSCLSQWHGEIEENVPDWRRWLQEGEHGTPVHCGISRCQWSCWDTLQHHQDWGVSHLNLKTKSWAVK